MKEYKKSYFGFWVWLLLFCVLTFGVCLIPKIKIQIIIAFVDNIMTIGCFVLSFIIYKTEYIYWYNGTSFEEAKEAGSDRRKRFALAHMKHFGYFALGFLIYSVISIFVGIPYGIDIAIVSVGIVLTAISTINIKL